MVDLIGMHRDCAVRDVIAVVNPSHRYRRHAVPVAA
jgi:hypothetical protein